MPFVGSRRIGADSWERELSPETRHTDKIYNLIDERKALCQSLCGLMNVRYPHSTLTI